MDSKVMGRVMMINILKKIFLVIHKSFYKMLDLKSFYYKFLLKKCGLNLKIYGNCYIKNPDKIIIGNNVSLNDGCYINGLGEIEIGNNVSISALSIIVSTGLNTKTLVLKKEHINKKIIIGNNVQIGAGTIILAGVTIGDNVIVGAGSVVTKNIESDSIVIGNPTKILRKI